MLNLHLMRRNFHIEGESGQDAVEVNLDPGQMVKELEGELVTAFLRRAYGWMFVGLAVSALTSFGVAHSTTATKELIDHQAVLFGPVLLSSLLFSFFRGGSTGCSRPERRACS
jgi:FtsH-binding integral membrane protein